MVHNVKVVPADTMVEHIQALLTEASAVPLVISGNSMSPFLVHGRDTVYLSRIEKPVKRGDMVLYRRENGSYILHRVYAVKGPLYDMVGDAQTDIELSVRREDMIAVVTSVNRKGKILKRNSFCWMFFEKIWIRMIKIRSFAVKFYSKLKG